MNIDICICTFRRPQIAETLKSIADLMLPLGYTIHVIVADNDETSIAKILITAAAAEHGLAITYIHAPARNISVARNACLDASTAPFIAFIDDDEVATQNWLMALISSQKNNNADVVLGPVQAIYPHGTTRWLQTGDFHSIRPVWVNGQITTGYTSNVLIRREMFVENNLRFKHELGRTGGEDTAFFDAIYHSGGRFAFAADALVTERAAPQRLKLQWLLRRYFRSGQTHGSLLLDNKLSRFHGVFWAGSKMLFCYMLIIPTLISPVRWRYWLLRGTLHAGVISRLLGKGELVQYG